jgi:hypothetical protein
MSKTLLNVMDLGIQLTQFAHQLVHVIPPTNNLAKLRLKPTSGRPSLLGRTRQATTPKDLVPFGKEFRMSRISESTI